MSKVRDEITQGNVEDFVAHRLIDTVPFVFGEDRAAYITWKMELGRRLSVDPYAMVITGSACVGVSLNPRKQFSTFGAGSDIDVALISGFYFDQGWRALRGMGSRILSLPPRERAAVYDHVNRLIYWGTIATDKILHLLPFGTEWLPALAAMRSLPPADGREVNVRVYRDFESLRAYQLQGVRKLRESVLAPKE